MLFNILSMFLWISNHDFLSEMGGQAYLKIVFGHLSPSPCSRFPTISFPIPLNTGLNHSGNFPNSEMSIKINI